MKILSAVQIRKADQFNIENEPVKSIDLMERASVAFVDRLVQLFPEKRTVRIFCGSGNNGGDGLAIARLLGEKRWSVSCYFISPVYNASEDFNINFERFSGASQRMESEADFPEIQEDDLVIDGLFGSGLSRPVTGTASQLIQYLNGKKVIKVSIDIASGLYTDRAHSDEAIIFRPHYTISFQTPKLAFFQPSLYDFVGEWFVVDIGLNTSFIEEQDSDFYFQEGDRLKELLPVRGKYSHKGNCGRLLLVAGSRGKMGAAILSARAALRAGIGVLWIHAPVCGVDVLQVAIPEAMVVEDLAESVVTEVKPTDGVTVAVGPGIGTQKSTVHALEQLIDLCEGPMVVDADAINILATHRELLSKLPDESILTPHPGEFRRLMGDWDNDFDKLAKLRALCLEFKLNVVLKGAYSAVCNSAGQIHFNPSGNPGLSTAGSGDVLTGIVASFLAVGLRPFEALQLGVYIHGEAGDFAAQKKGQQSLIASDIIDNIYQAVRS